MCVLVAMELMSNLPTPMPKIDINDLPVSQAEAYALAQLCKRISWEVAREMTTTQQEIGHLFAGLEALRRVLAAQGIHVR